MNKGKFRKATKQVISMVLVAVLLVLSLPQQFLQTYATAKSQWEIITPPSEDMTTGVFGNGTFLIMDYYGKVYGSKDGKQWEEYAQIDVSEYYISGAELSYCGEYFYLYGNQGLFLYSKDGKQWDSVDMGSYQIVNIVQNQGRYYAVSEIRTDHSGDTYLVKDSKFLYSDNGYDWQEFDTEVETERYLNVQCGNNTLALSTYDMEKSAVIVYLLDYDGKMKSYQEFPITQLPQSADGKIHYVDDCFVTCIYTNAYILDDNGSWQENQELSDKLCGYYSNVVYLEDQIIVLDYSEMYTCFDVKEEPETWYRENLPLDYTTGFIYGAGKAIIFSSSSMATKVWNAAKAADEYNAAKLPEESVSGNETVSGNDSVSSNQPEDTQSIPSKLTEDLVISGDVVLDGQNVDLNGYSLTIQGDLLHSAGTLLFDGGTLTVEGNYRMQAINETGDYCVSSGLLVMQNEKDYLHIKGNYYNATTADERGYLTNGVIEVEGDFLVLQGAGEYAFAAGQNQLVKLSGTQEQQVGAENAEIPFTMANVEIANSSDSGVVFQNDPLVLKEINDYGNQVGGRIAIGTNTTFTNNEYHGSVITIESIIIKQPWHISGDFTTDSYVRVKGEFTIDGSLVIKTEYVECSQGQIYVGGDLEATKESGGQGLVMNHEDDLVRVTGNLTYEIENENVQLQGGTIEAAGDVYLNQGYIPGEEHKLILNGSTLQKIYVDDEISLTTLELKNESKEGIWSPTVLRAEELILNGCLINYGEGNAQGIMGYTLTQDEVIEGDCYLMDGTLNLNGYTLTIKGDLIQASGMLDVHGGKLVVEGDYRLQFLENGEENNPGYGILKMTEEGDYVIVKGDFVITSQSSLEGYLTEGTLEVRGDFSQSGGTNFVATQNHNTYFTGRVDEEGNKITQTATFKSTISKVRFQNLLLNYDFKNYYKFVKSSTSYTAKTTYMEDTTSPVAVTGIVTEVPEYLSVKLSWNATTDNVAVTGYDIYRNGEKIATTTELEYMDAGLEVGEDELL